MNAFETLFDRLDQSSFRRKFKLGDRERLYLQTKGMATVLDHAADFVEQRLAPAHPANDGRQTPWRGHPAFIAQHATGTCCRRCLHRWHHLAPGQALTPAEQNYVVAVIEAWLTRQIQPPTALEPTKPIVKRPRSG